MSTIKERLRQALELRGRNMRWLHKELDGKVLGSSYANVHACVEGDTQPSVAFLAATAAALQVNPEWLAFEKGHITDAEAVVDSATASWEATEETVLEELRRSFPATGRLVAGFAITTVFRLWEHVIAARAKRDGNSGDFIENAQRVGAAMQAPLEALEVDVSQLSMWRLETYTTLMTQALRAVIVTPNELKPQSFIFGTEEASDA